MLYHLGNVVEILLEFDGETVLNGEEDGASVLNIDLGIKFAPFKSKDIKFGFGAGFPMTNDKEFEYRLIGSTICLILICSEKILSTPGRWVR